MDLPSSRLLKLINYIPLRQTDLCAVFFLRIAGLVSLVFVFICLVMGFVKMAIGALEFSGLEILPARSEGAVNVSFGDPNFGGAIGSLMSGLEFFLLAPLVYLLPRTLGNYIFSTCGKFAYPQHSEGHLHEVMSVKVLVTALLIAVLATHLVADLLNVTGTVNLGKILVGSVVLLILISYFVAQEILCIIRSRESGPSKEKERAVQKEMMGLFSPEIEEDLGEFDGEEQANGTP